MQRYDEAEATINMRPRRRTGDARQHSATHLRQLSLRQFSRPKPPPCWGYLPDDLWITIFEQTDAETRQNCIPRVCKKFEELSRSPALCQKLLISPKVVQRYSAPGLYEFLNIMPWLRKRLPAAQYVELADFAGSACSPELAVALVQSVLVQLSGAPLLTALVVRATCKGRYNIYGLDAIARLTHLKMLHLDGMPSAVRAPEFEALCTLPALQLLHLGLEHKGATFGGPPALKAVPFGRMSTALKSLSLMGERIRRRHAATAEMVFSLGDVSADLGRLRALETLELINCGVKSLPEAISGLTALTRLVVLTAPDDKTHSHLLPPPAVDLPGSMTQLTRLQSISLSSQRLPGVVGRIRSLLRLRLSHLGQPGTAVAGEGAESIVAGAADVSSEALQRQLAGLSSVPQLSSLWLHDGGPKVGDAVQGLRGCSALLRLRMERIGCNSELGPNLDSCCFLKQLELCTFVDIGIDFIPDDVVEMAAVTRLDFRANSDMQMDYRRLGEYRSILSHTTSLQALMAVQDALTRPDGSAACIHVGNELRYAEDADEHGAYMTTLTSRDFW